MHAYAPRMKADKSFEEQAKEFNLDGRNIELVSRDEIKLKYKRVVWERNSELIRNMLEEDDGEDEVPSIPIPNVDSDVLATIYEFYLQHINDKKYDGKYFVIPTSYHGVELMHLDGVTEWDVKFLDFTLKDKSIFRILEAANYLNCRDILAIICAYLASRINSASIDELRDDFGVSSFDDDVIGMDWIIQ
mgnify:CR=1 FL=1